MAEPTKPDLTYVCPHCGQKAILGTHFCKTIEAAPDQEPKKKSGATNRWVYAVAGVFLLVIVLWRWLGPGALLVVALALLGYLAFQGSKNQPGAAYRELVKLCGNEETAERLIEAEVKKKPNSSRRQATRTALERYQRDISR